MGTLLGMIFILGAAAAGIFVGTRPTVMDGRWIAEKLEEGGGGEPGSVVCDRAIRVGVAGAEFTCTHALAGGPMRAWYRMARDGSLERTRTRRGPGARVEDADEDEGEGEGQGQDEGER